MTDYFYAGFFCYPFGCAFSFSALGLDSWQGSGGDILLTSKDISLEVYNGKRWCHTTRELHHELKMVVILDFSEEKQKQKINQKVIKMKNTKTIQKDEIRCKKVKFCILKIGIF